MSENVVIAVIGGAVTLLVGFLAAAVAIWVYRAGERSRAKDALAEKQRLMVVRMLDTIESAIHSRATPSIFRPWRDPTVDLTLALPRLLLELPEADLPVATWAAAQVQRAATTIRLRDFLDRVMQIEGKLISWHRGDVATSWFIEQLTTEPYDPDFHLSAAVRARMWLRDVAQGAAHLVAWAYIAKTLRDSFRL